MRRGPDKEKMMPRTMREERVSSGGAGKESASLVLRNFRRAEESISDAGTAPSNLAIIGRYVLTPKIFDKLEQTPRGANGEIQLTDAIEMLMQEQGVYGCEFDGVRYDAGTTMGWLKASVELALQRPDLGGEFRSYLRTLDL